MSQRHPTEETREQAVLYALGLLEAGEARAFGVHLEEGCAACESELRQFEQVVAQLGFSAGAVQPPAAVRAQLMSRIGSQATSALPGLLFVRSGEGLWQDLADGISMKVLFADPTQARVTAVVRMAAGSRYGAHRHAAVEELYVLEGSCVCGGQLLRAGDYHRAEAGSVHVPTCTDDGCLMLITTSQRNEMLEER